MERVQYASPSAPSPTLKKAGEKVAAEGGGKGGRNKSQEPLIPPAFAFFIRLPEDGGTGFWWLDLHQPTMHGAYAFIEFRRQVIDLHKLLRQVAARVSQMQHAAISVVHFLGARMPHG